MKECGLSFFATVCHLLLGAFLLVFWGIATSGINQILEPYGYLLRFLSYAGLVYLSIVWLCRLNGLTLADCRISKIRLSLRGIGVAVLLPLVFLAIHINMQQGHWVCGMSGEQMVAKWLFLLFNTGFCSAVTEEMMFRGYLTTLAQWRWGKVWGVVVPAVLFSLAHCRDGTEQVLAKLLIISSLGILLAVITCQSGQIWDAVLIHACWNIFVAKSEVFAVGLADTNACLTFVLTGKSLINLNKIGAFVATITVLWGAIGALLLYPKIKNKIYDIIIR